MLNQRKERLNEQGPDPLTPRQMLLRIIEIVSGDRMSEEKLQRILRAVEAIAAEDDQKV
jgi:hypothetical protein